MVAIPGDAVCAADGANPRSVVRFENICETGVK